ncbi:MAG: M28 family peptidase [Ignavibacteriales bacterium]|nr:M28 family peptidase [Ignavibacteriales bacterium]
MTQWLRFASLAFALILTSHGLWAQSTPFLTDDEIRMLSNEISGDRAFEHIRVLSRWHRDSGTDGYFKAAEYVMQAAREAGLEDVRFIEQPLSGPNYTAHSAELWMIEPVEVKLADIGDHATYLADGSHDADVTAELIWIGGASSAEVNDREVRGKIVLTSGSPTAAVLNAVHSRGALGVVSYQSSESKNPMDYPDQIGWNRIPVRPPEGKPGTFAFMLSPRKGDALRKILETSGMQDFLATGKETKGGRIVVRALVDTEIGTTPGRTGFVEGWIRGSKHKDQQIVLTAHLQEEQGSANDDGSGCGNLLELARVFNKLIREGKMTRPLRDLRFWWVDEIYSEYRYFSDYPEEIGKIIANLHQDMTGANQALGSRVQHLIFAPHSRTSYLDALFESIGTYVILTNNGFLAASRQGGLPRPFTRPIFSARGSRQGYNARFVPHFGSSDHMVFVDGGIGIPAVAMINWDDDFIHSSDDDLHQIDQTQLQRNNFIIGAMAYRLAVAMEQDAPLFFSETFAQGTSRLSNDLKAAAALIRSSGGSPESWKDALMVVEQGVEREQRAMRSAKVFGGMNGSADRMIAEFSKRLEQKGADLREDLRIVYNSIFGKEPGSPKLTPAEVSASRKKPTNVMPLGIYLAKRRGISSKAGGSLHGLMRGEVFAFVDGQRSYYDIYKAVRAEALAAGSWYYGTVTLDDVVSLLDAGVSTGAWTLK